MLERQAYLQSVSLAFAKLPTQSLQSIRSLSRLKRQLKPASGILTLDSHPYAGNRRDVHCTVMALSEAATAGIFAASTVYTVGLGALMILAPHFQQTYRVMRSIWVLTPLALAYGVLLWFSWEADTLSLILPGSWEEGFKGFNPQFFPELRGIMALFSRVPTAASLWVHLLAINLFAARKSYLEGLNHNVPSWHSILLCLTLSPVGLLSHAITQWLWRLNRPENGYESLRHRTSATISANGSSSPAT